MRRVTVFDTLTGQIISQENVRRGLPRPPRRGRGWLAGAHDGSEVWIDPETRRPRPLGLIEAQVTHNQVAGLPEGSKALVALKKHSVVDGRITISVRHPQNILVRVECPRYKPAEFEVPCVPEVSGEIEIEQDTLRMRKCAYPSVGDQLDALWRGFDALAHGEQIPAETLRILDEVQGVKAKFPK